MKPLDIVLTLFFPPVAVAIRRGVGKQFGLNVLLTIVGWLPGVIHAWYVVSKTTTTSELQNAM